MGWWLVNNGKPLCLYNQQPPNSPFRSGISTISKGIYVFWLYIHLYKYFKYQVKKQQYVWYKKITVEKKTKRNHWTIFSHMNIQTWLVMSLQHIFAYPCKMSQEWTNYLGDGLPSHLQGTECGHFKFP